MIHRFVFSAPGVSLCLDVDPVAYRKLKVKDRARWLDNLDQVLVRVRMSTPPKAIPHFDEWACTVVDCARGKKVKA